MIRLYLILFLAGVGYVAARTDQCKNPNDTDTLNYDVCNYIGEPLEELLKLFDQEEVDLVFVVDLSLSVSTKGIKEAKQNIIYMLEYLSTRGFIFKHYCFTRIAIATFEEVAIAAYDEITKTKYDPDEQRTLCTLRKDVEDNRVLNWEPQGSSNVNGALLKAEELFLNSARAATSRKVIWFYGDGDITDKEVNHTATLHRLKTERGVKVVTGGVGEWFGCLEQVKQLQVMATSASLYACAADWIKFAASATYPKVAPKKPFAQAGSNDCGSTCQPNTYCTCDLATFNLTCKDDEIIDEDLQRDCKALTTTTRAPPIPTVTVIVTLDPPVDNDLWILVGGTVGGIIFVVVLFVGIGCLIFITIRTKPRGAPLPPPPVMQQLRHGGGAGNEYEDIYATWVPKEESGPTNKQEKIYTDIDALNLRFISDLAEEETMTVPQDEIVYVTRAKLLAKNEKHMQGWGVFLADLKAKYHLMHISVVSLSNRRAAWTQGFQLPDKEVRHMSSLMDSMKHGAPTQRVLTVLGQEYTLSDSEMSEHHLYGYRDLGAGKEAETAWVVRSGKYVIVAVAPESRNEASENLVHEIYRYLNIMTESPYGEF